MRQPWTDAEVEVLRTFVVEHQPRTLAEWGPLCVALKRTAHSCRTKAKVEGIKIPPRVFGEVFVAPKATNTFANDGTPTPEPTFPNDTSSGRVESPSESVHVSSALHVKKLHVHVPPPAPPKAVSKLLTAVLYGDSHFPFQDNDTLRIVAQVIRVAQPDVLIDMGDGVDAYHLSRFDKNPKRSHTLQDEIDAYRAHLVGFRALAPSADFYVLEGNHPDRLRRMLWNMPEHVKALMDLRAFTEAMTWPKLLGLEELGIEFIPYGEETKRQILPKFVVKHGSVVRQLSAYTARAELNKYNKSGASGHTHRLGVFFHRDLNGNHVWVETGCTCKLDPEYAQDPDWQAGCVVMTFEPTTGAFQCEPVYIHNGSALFRGKFYDCKGEI